MTTLPISSTAAMTPAAASAASSDSANAPSAAKNLASQNVFLQLLVAQLKNQDPQQPTDGTAFVTQLAQFTTLQEDTKSRTDLDEILATMKANSPVANS